MAAAAAASKLLARDSPRLTQRRVLSSRGTVHAAEHLLIKQMEKENQMKGVQPQITKDLQDGEITKDLQDGEKTKYLQDGEGLGSTEASARVQASCAIAYLPPEKVSIVDLMDKLEKFEYDPLELKYALRILKKKCGPHLHVIERDLFLENQALRNADKEQLEYVNDVAKDAILRAELKQAQAAVRREQNKGQNFNSFWLPKISRRQPGNFSNFP